MYTDVSVTEEQDPMSIFLYALKASETKRPHPSQFKVFYRLHKIISQKRKGKERTLYNNWSTHK